MNFTHNIMPVSLHQRNSSDTSLLQKTFPKLLKNFFYPTTCIAIISSGLTTHIHQYLQGLHRDPQLPGSSHWKIPAPVSST
ncbi:unnamed protein product, partial [Amoebophrya sp. A25]|eukprot:GSA25T00028001001.1